MQYGLTKKLTFLLYESIYTENDFRLEDDICEVIHKMQEEEWSDLYNNYSTLKGMLVKKYGRYKVCVERFNSSYSPTSDGSRMTLLFLDKCKYYVIWETVNGTIKLDLVKGSSVTSGGKVRLQYWDKKNTEVINEKALEDL